MTNAGRKLAAAVQKKRQGEGYGPGGRQPYARPGYGSPQTDAERRWQQSTMPDPVSQNGAAQAHPLPNTRKRKPKPIPNAQGSGPAGRQTFKPTMNA